MTTPTIPAGNLFMNATLYTGTNASQTVTNGVTGQSFQPDFVWAKVRNQAYTHVLSDSIRGVGTQLFSNNTNAEQTNATYLSSFNTNGFSMAGGNTGTGAVNTSGDTYVAWQWKAGGSAVSNTNGTITSSVSANTTSGFSVVTYTGNLTAGATVGHGLGVAPSMIIIKARSQARQWEVYHISLGWTNNLVLNATDASSASTGLNNTTPSSTVFTLGATNNTNYSGGTMLAYCWTPIAGYSAFGSYTGNGSTDGPFVYTGFQPRFVLVKYASGGSAADWLILDTSRNPYNVANTTLRPNTSAADESTNPRIDILSNGFKVRAGSGIEPNQSGATYIYAVFASNPFKYANAF